MDSSSDWIEIEEIEAENLRLNREVNRWRDKADVKSILKQQAEEQVD